jgi:hypothetical protein
MTKSGSNPTISEFTTTTPPLLQAGVFLGGKNFLCLRKTAM